MDLIVDASLDETNTDLKAIHDEFDNIQNEADQNAGIWGQSDLEKAMGDFAHDWYVHRDAINSRLSALSDRVDKACAAWSDAEKQLAGSIETQNGNTSA